MIAGLVAIGAILIGLPLVAWWVGGRPVWNRLRPSGTSDPWFRLVREHGLTGAEASRVMTAVSSGQALEAPRLRRAAHDWATQVRDRQFSPRRRSRVLLVLAGLYGALLVGGTVLAIIDGRPIQIPWSGFFLVGSFTALHTLQRRNVLRAIELNADRDDPSRENGSDRHLQPGRADS